MYVFYCEVLASNVVVVTCQASNNNIHCDLRMAFHPIVLLLLFCAHCSLLLDMSFDQQLKLFQFMNLLQVSQLQISKVQGRGLSSSLLVSSMRMVLCTIIFKLKYLLHLRCYVLYLLSSMGSVTFTLKYTALRVSIVSPIYFSNSLSSFLNCQRFICHWRLALYSQQVANLQIISYVYL